MIKVFVVENGVEKQCIRTIPVEKAPPEIIAQIENLTFLDMMMINDLKTKKNLRLTKKQKIFLKKLQSIINTLVINSQSVFYIVDVSLSILNLAKHLINRC